MQGQEVTITDMMFCRDRRVQIQNEFIEKYQKPVISFCMNIPGPIKTTPLIRKGFEAGKDVDYVVETKRGHYLGKILDKGSAIENTGIPGIIGGYGKERVIHAPATGKLHILRQIGEIVEAGDILADIEGTPVETVIGGVIRGMIREGYPVKKGLKIADVDPRVKEQENCYHISDKARCVAGGVLEAILHLLK